MREQEKKDLKRFACIGVAVAAGIALVGVVVIGLTLGREGEDALQGVGVLSFVSTFVVIHGLDERAKRQRQRDQ